MLDDAVVSHGLEEEKGHQYFLRWQLPPEFLCEKRSICVPETFGKP